MHPFFPFGMPMVETGIASGRRQILPYSIDNAWEIGARADT